MLFKKSCLRCTGINADNWTYTRSLTHNHLSRNQHKESKKKEIDDFFSLDFSWMDTRSDWWCWARTSRTFWRSSPSTSSSSACRSRSSRFIFYFFLFSNFTSVCMFGSLPEFVSEIFIRFWSELDDPTTQNLFCTFIFFIKSCPFLLIKY